MIRNSTPFAKVLNGVYCSLDIIYTPRLGPAFSPHWKTRLSFPSALLNWKSSVLDAHSAHFAQQNGPFDRIAGGFRRARDSLPCTIAAENVRCSRSFEAFEREKKKRKSTTMRRLFRNFFSCKTTWSVAEERNVKF